MEAAVLGILGLRLAGAEITVRAETADAALAQDLACREGDAVLVTEIRFRTADRQPVEFTVARHRADLFSLTYDVPNDSL